MEKYKKLAERWRLVPGISKDECEKNQGFLHETDGPDVGVERAHRLELVQDTLENIPIRGRCVHILVSLFSEFPSPQRPPPAIAPLLLLLPLYCF